MYNPNEAPQSHQTLYYELFDPVIELVQKSISSEISLSVSITKIILKNSSKLTIISVCCRPCITVSRKLFTISPWINQVNLVTYTQKKSVLKNKVIYFTLINQLFIILKKEQGLQHISLVHTFLTHCYHVKNQI